ncbi:substrate-binding domain-containing protein [Brasilonema bromeliae]|uniref:Serine/threonine protein kinase n=1 Tax=Brasilonema bromeliae SPC951 TaxID=385972 RepID=A0ABX1P1N2_9CYAN|nr:substrate-binding domain-containing protein [Brasilonema bromeliae]NMG18240.1 serine/threonine protein kinase [Brasilonema bromeliae SPC951]
MSSTELFYKEYPCSHNAHLDCEKVIETLQEVKGAKFCFECGFPTILPEEAEIKGYRGSYRVTKFLGVRGFGRLYSGIQLKDKQPVIIKEYLLPSRTFNQDEINKRKEAFRRVGGIDLADNRVQNFRLIQTWEAISPEKGESCYLITKDVQPSQTLRQYLKQNGAMTPEQVRELLSEVLQTLEFLHSQKLRFSSNQIQRGLEHGNINLDSVLIKVENKQRFVVYLCDLAIWENLFIPPSIPQPKAKTHVQDLESLGLVAFQLWVGQTQLDPKDHQVWPDNDNYLKQFIYRLLSLNTPYGSAEIARQELLKLPQPDESDNLRPSSDSQEQKKRFFKKYWLWLGVLAFLLLGGAIWYYFWQRFKLDEDQYLKWQGLAQNFSKVDNVPSGTFTYTGEKDDTWSYILRQNAENAETKLNDIFTNPKPDAKVTFTYQQVRSSDITKVSKPIEEVQKGGKDFAITTLFDNITPDMNSQQVAYDGLLVFIAFSQNDFSLHKKLDGKISLEDLRGIYTGKIIDWHQINKNAPRLPIERYVPTEPEAIQQFKKLVLKNNSQDIALFEEITKTRIRATDFTQRQIRTANKKGQTGIISFGIFSKTWNQCSGYPLAIVNDNNKTIQPLLNPINKRPIEPSYNFCDRADFDTRSFQANGTANYPLGYPLYVVYPKDNTRQLGGFTFAELLKTRQGQCLLNQVGLVPLQPMPNHIKNDACKSVP